MLTRLQIRSFKRFDDVDIELGDAVVFIGPNNSGKTTALQALALWDIGLRKWNERREGKTTPEKRPGVTINRRDLIAVPVPNAKLLWQDLRVRNVEHQDGRPKTSNICLEVIVEGVANDRIWTCGLEFDYANEESFYCRPLRRTNGSQAERMPVPAEASSTHIAFLPPMSGLAANEVRLDIGAINVRIGEGRTAEVLRNLCHRISENSESAWNRLGEKMTALFGVSLDQPRFVAERGEIEMTYRSGDGVRLDLSSAGRGLQQTLLLLAHLELNPGSVLLLDEPDAHLEILRQRQVYDLISRTAREQKSQVVAATHSEIILNEAADRDVVVAFLGKPHRIDDRSISQLAKSLKAIGFDQYYQAEQTGWVLYLEGSTDLAILQAFARTLDHPAQSVLEKPFVHYVCNQPQQARDHFYGLREAKADLVGFLLCDKIDKELDSHGALTEVMWRRREIENYLCQPKTLLAFARAWAAEQAAGPLFESSLVERHQDIMQECLGLLVPRIAINNPNDPWWIDVKASDEFLDRLFALFAEKLGLSAGFVRKSDYHCLAEYVSRDDLDAEVVAVLDAIQKVSESAKPV